MSWDQTIPALIVTVLVVFVPGLAWGYVLGLRRLTLCALAGPFSVTAVVVAAELAAITGVSWSVLPVVAVTILVGLLLWLVRRSWGKYLSTGEPGHSRWFIAAWAVAAVPTAGYLLWIFGSPENIAHSHDNVFHLNALRYISETANSSSLTLGYLGTRSGVFYPAGWHAVVSVVMSATGLSIPAAINVVNLVLITGIWSVGCLFLVSRVTGERRTALLVAAVMSTAYSTFPYLLLEFGVVYPFMLSIAMLPAVLGLVIQLLRLGKPTPLTATGNAVLLIGILPGLALVHPSAVVGSLGLSVPLVLAAAFRRHHGRRRRTVLLGTIAYLAVVVVAWWQLRPGRNTNWDELGDVQSALIGVLFQSPLGRPAAALAAVLTVIGAVVVLRRRKHRWTIPLYGVAALLFVVGNWKEAPELRWALTGIWYNDFFRISALLPVAGIILASIGGVALVERVRGPRVLGRWKGAPAWIGPAAAVVLVVAGLVVAPIFAARQAIQEAAVKYRFTEDSHLLTLDELELIRRLPENVEPEAVLIGSPLTGAALSYSYTGLATVLPYGTTAASDEGKLLFAELDELLDNPAVCDAAAALSVDYVLDFGNSSVHPGERVVDPGLQELTVENGFELVDSEGEARLYRITGC
ncbi:DUF6541 family protein [Arthrobacter sp. H5]|uniref:DUF6541 family protein n=1 Tax=Arthrobacter sp. H5 TaxID=1267973 RepID=UPI000483E7BA|nr:DUF6541 family protein [Arthrobacter sp. H5]